MMVEKKKKRKTAVTVGDITVPGRAGKKLVGVPTNALASVNAALKKKKKK